MINNISFEELGDWLQNQRFELMGCFEVFGIKIYDLLNYYQVKENKKQKTKNKKQKTKRTHARKKFMKN